MPAHVVGEDEDDVGPFGGSGWSAEATEQHGEEEDAFHRVFFLAGRFVALADAWPGW